MSSESALRDGNAAGFELIETLRWEPGTGFLRFDRHLARLCGSAAELGFACDPRTDRRGAGATRSAAHDRRCACGWRLPQTATSTASAQPFEPLAADTVWTLRLARTRLDSGDPLLRHKTTPARSSTSSARRISRRARPTR